MKMELRGGGTAPYYQDGTLLGTEGPLSAFQNTGTVVSTSLTAFQSYAFRMCAIYGAAPKIYCSAEYHMVWTPPVGTPTPVINSPSSTETSVTFGWTTFPQYPVYNVQLDDANQHSPAGPPFTYNNLMPGEPHNVRVQGCIPQGENPSNCSTFSPDFQIITAPALQWLQPRVCRQL